MTLYIGPINTSASLELDTKEKDISSTTNNYRDFVNSILNGNTTWRVKNFYPNFEEIKDIENFDFSLEGDNQDGNKNIEVEIRNSYDEEGDNSEIRIYDKNGNSITGSISEIYGQEIITGGQNLDENEIHRLEKYFDGIRISILELIKHNCKGTLLSQPTLAFD